MTSTSRRRCPVCRSKQWHKEPSSGVITCSEGHVLQDYRNETNERAEFGPHVMKKRKLKSERKNKGARDRANPELYHGERARYLYFECLQLLMRKQIAALIDLWALPPEFETICRDIWTMHLSLLPSPPHKPDADAEASGGSSSKIPSGDNNLSDKEEENASDSSSSSSGEEEEDAELAELLRQNSEIESSEDEDENTHNSGRAERYPGSDRRKRWRMEDGPMGNIAVLVVSLWCLRIPITYMDIIRLIRMYLLPYLDPARLHLPEVLIRHLTKHMRQALSPRRSPITAALHRASARLAKNSSISYDVYVPEYNAAATLWRAVRHLGGNTVVYAMAKRLGQTIDVSLAIHPVFAPSLARRKSSDPKVHQRDNSPPELALIALVIIALKLVYGLDGNNRSHPNEWDPGLAMPSVLSYLDLLHAMNEADRHKSENMFPASADFSILDYSDEDLDGYLDFCQRALLGESVGVQDSSILSGFFPLEKKRASGSGATDVRTPLANTMPANDQRWQDTDLMPGRKYFIYSAHDLTGTLPAQFELVVERAAKWVGVDSDEVCALVERFERRAVRWEKTRRRESRATSGGQSE